MPDQLTHTDIKFLKGVGPKRGQLLQNELGINNLKDLLYYFPYKYIDRSKFHLIKDITPNLTNIQIV